MAAEIVSQFKTGAVLVYDADGNLNEYTLAEWNSNGCDAGTGMTAWVGQSVEGIYAGTSDYTASPGDYGTVYVEAGAGINGVELNNYAVYTDNGGIYKNSTSDITNTFGYGGEGIIAVL